MPPRTEFETRLKAARVVASGGSLREAARQTGLNVSTISRWAADEEPEFMEALEVVRAYDELHADDHVAAPTVFAGALGRVLGDEISMNDRIRAAAGRL